MNRCKEDTMQGYEIEHTRMIREIAAESTVLLKKDGSFPMNETGDIAVYGNGARHTIKGGTGSGDVNVHQFVTIEEGLENAGFHIVTKDWMDQYDAVLYDTKKAFYSGLKEQAKAVGLPVTMIAVGKVVPEAEYEIPIQVECDTAIYCLARNSGEGGDRRDEKGDIRLTDTEVRDILEINKKYKHFMLVLNTGGMVDLAPVKEVKNILVLGQLGSSTGEVLADILTGKSYPSGKLTMTWADLEKYPTTQGFGDMNDTCYQEGILVGYRYFEKAKEQVMYPFGYGLGFTEFEIGESETNVSKRIVSVKVKVTNTGLYKGKEVVQLYVSKPDEKMCQPVKELIGFSKTKELDPGETDVVEIKFDVESIASFCEKYSAYVLLEGNYYLSVGSDSANTRVIACLKNEEQKVCSQLKNLLTTMESESELKLLPICEEKNGQINETNVKTFIIDSDAMTTESVTYEAKKEWPKYKENDHKWEEVISGDVSVEEFASSLTDEELAYVCCGANVDGADMGSIIGAASTKVAGAAGETTGKLKESRHLDSIVLCDGPAGVRIAPAYTIHDDKVKAKQIAFGSEILEYLEEEDRKQMTSMIDQNTNSTSSDEDEVYYQYCTAIPIATDIAQSFNTDLAKVYGKIVGEEMHRFGVQLWLAPALNIQRSPLCGRNFEYYSEDPYVSGVMAAAIVESVQSAEGCGVTLKHFACNNQETNRYGSNSVVSERALREIYLKGFEIAVKNGKPKSIMTSYNLLNGEHTANKKELLTEILRDEWKFDGMVMTDWFTSTALMNVPGNKYANASAAGCVKAGNNLIMPGMSTDIADIKEALEDEQHPYAITRDDLINCAIPVLKCIWQSQR